MITTKMTMMMTFDDSNDIDDEDDNDEDDKDDNAHLNINASVYIQKSNCVWLPLKCSLTQIASLLRVTKTSVDQLFVNFL